jgi:tellurite resistance protein
VAVLGQGTAIGENFLRIAVMVAIADGVYALSEEEILQQFCLVLELDTKALTALLHSLEDTE